MKKILSVLLALLLLLSTVPLSVFAVDADCSIIGTVDKATVCPGQEITLTVSMENNPGVACWLVQVAYDDTAMTLVRQNQGAAFTGGSYSFGPKSNPTTAMWYDFLNGNYTNNGTLFTLTFEVSEDAPVGHYDFDLYINDEENILNQDLDTVYFDFVSPSVEVGHTYSSDCDDTCDGCGAVRKGAGHIYSSPEDLVCDRCGAVLDPSAAMICGEVNNPNVTRGDTFTLSVVMKNNPGLAGWLVRTAFDESDLELLSITRGTAFDSGSFSVSNLVDQSPASAMWANFIMTENCRDNGTLYTLTFRVKDTADFGVSHLSIYCDSPEDISNLEFEAVPFAFANSAVTVLDHTHGYDNNCDAVCDECGYTRTPADHVYTDACDTTCNECGEARVAPHTYASDCDRYCDGCGAPRASTPASHRYSNSCDTECNACGEVRTITHTYSNACDAACNVCGHIRVPADHVYTNACDAYCNVCNAYRVPASHVYDNACDAYCNVCNAYRTPSEHVYTITSSVDPGCATNGSLTWTCGECGNSYVETLSPLGHSYATVVTNPTCTSRGYTTYTCTRCNRTYTDNYIDALGHLYGDWITDSTPNCTESGSRHRNCQRCPHQETVSIAPLGHTYTDTVVLPSCTARGYTLHVCTECKYNYKDAYTAVLPHSYGDWIVDTAATVLAEGSHHHVCSVCAHREDEVIPRVIVDINTNENYGLANFTVVNAQTKEPIPNANIFISTEKDGENTFVTDANGKVSLVLPVGKQTISAYATNCLTRNLTITVKPGVNDIPLIGLSDKSTYDVELNSERMTLDEIIDAGIDVTAPENQHVYKYELKLEFEAGIDWESIFYFNGDGECIVPDPNPDPDPLPPDPVDPDNPGDPSYTLHYHVTTSGYWHSWCNWEDVSYGENVTLSYYPQHYSKDYVFDGWYLDKSFTSKISSVYIEDYYTEVYGRWIYVGEGEEPDPIPSFRFPTEDEVITIYPVSEYFYLIIRGEVTWLKEMFDVEMLIINNSETDTLEDLTATLELPEGLSLATMVGEQQTPSQYIDLIPEGESETVHWYVRGDTAGSYSLQAKLQGMVMPFEEPIDDLFVAENEITVWAGNAMHLHFEFPDTAYYAEDYVITTTLTNVSDITLYNVQHLLQIEQGMTVYYSDGSSKSKIETSNWVNSGRLREFHPGDQIIIEASVNIFFESEVIQHQLEKWIGLVDGIETMLNAFKAIKAVYDITNLLTNTITGCLGAIDDYIDSAAGLVDKLTLAKELHSSLSDLYDACGTTGNSTMDAAGTLANSTLHATLEVLTADPVAWLQNTPVTAVKQVISDIRALHASLAAPSRKFDIFDSIRTAISAIPVVFTLSNVIMTEDPNNTTNIPWSYSTYHTGPHYFGVSNVSKYISALIQAGFGELYDEFAPGWFQLIPGLDDPLNADEAIRYIQATEDEIAKFQARTASGDVSFRVWVVRSGQVVEDDAFHLSSDNETASYKDGVLTFTGNGSVDVTPLDGADGTLYIEDSEGNTYTYEMDVVEQHECTAGAQQVVIAPTADIDGFAVKTCTICNDVMEVIDLPAAAACTTHTYGTWEPYTAYDCTTRGMNVRTCSACGAAEYEFVGGEGHVSDGWTVTKEATCISAGEKVGYCKVCDSNVVETIDPFGHGDLTWKVVEEAGPFHEGVREQWCGWCHQMVLTEAIPMTQESFGYGEESGFIVGLPAMTTPEMLIEHYENMGLEATVTGPNGENVDYIGSGCKVSFGDTEYEVIIAGDIDGDAKINLQDLGLMMRYMNGWDDPAYHAACDVNGDGKVNNRDFALLQRYLNGWDVTLSIPAV